MPNGIGNLPTDSSFYKFVGRTIEKLVYNGPYIYIKFTDATTGYIENNFPIHIYGRDVLHEHENNGDLNLLGSHSDEW